MILPRILTAIVGIPIILIVVYFGNIPFFVFVFGITLFALQEYFYLIEKTKFKPDKLIGYLFGILVVLSVFFSGTKILSRAENQLTALVFTFGLMCMFLYEIIKLAFTDSIQNSLGKISTTFLGVFIICWTFTHLLLIRDFRPGGVEYTYYLFGLIWSTDTAAYLFGSKFGKRRLSERVSPKKSVEGALAGIVVGILTGILLWKFLPLKEQVLTENIVLSVVMILLCYISDLSESLIKRSAGVKDTDTLLPGHGGILDRFDSFIFTAPALYYYISFFK